MTLNKNTTVDYVLDLCDDSNFVKKLLQVLLCVEKIPYSVKSLTERLQEVKLRS